jgi:hypothetical protein
MPLIKGKSKASFHHNIRAEVKVGKPIKQAVAISYSVAKQAKQDCAADTMPGK